MTDLPALAEIVQQHTGRLIHKWSHYFPIYERYLSSYRGMPMRLLEIGVSHGGSLQMWKRYFGEDAAVVGVDIDPRCRDYGEDGIDIEIGDQADSQFWSQVVETHGDFDVIIDDGSHMADHQRAAFLSLWPHLRDGGTYVIEDCHTAYWQEFGGGVRTGNSVIDFAKDRIDDLNALWSRDLARLAPSAYTSEIGGIHFHDSMIVFNKNVRAQLPHRVVAGSFSHPEPSEDLAVLLEAHGKAPDR